MPAAPAESCWDGRFIAGSTEMNAIRALARKAEALACALLVTGAVVAGSLAPGAAFAQKPGAFDHLRTGFPLSGAHQAVRCDSCHQRGVFKGTPTRCAACHTVGSRVASVVMPKNHIPVTQPCESCHNTATFAGARFTHVGIAPGTCATCHNGNQATGKPSGHMVTTASCDTCHRTSSYRPAFFNH